MNYSFSVGLSKAIKFFVIFALPFLVDQFIFQYPQIAQLTVGAVLVLLVNWLKVKIGVKFL